MNMAGEGTESDDGLLAATDRQEIGRGGTDQRSPGNRLVPGGIHLVVYHRRWSVTAADEVVSVRRLQQRWIATTGEAGALVDVVASTYRPQQGAVRRHDRRHGRVVAR